MSSDPTPLPATGNTHDLSPFGADEEEDGKYRHLLWRVWSDAPLLGWVMLNPSTAGAWEDDPTIRRVSGFTEQWGFGGVVVANLFPLRATDPGDLHDAENRLGKTPDRGVLRLRDLAADVVLA